MVQAEIVHDYRLGEEKSPLCILPAPFNALTIMVYPLHYYVMSKFKISIAGTIGNMVLR